MASSPTRLPENPPPNTMRSACFQDFSLRKRRSTPASSCAKEFDCSLHDPGRFDVALSQQIVELLLGDLARLLVAEGILADAA